MVRKIDWDSQIGRRLRLRDLYVFLTVAQCGSMAKAAAQLGVSHPTVSEVIADLEHSFGVRLFDRSARGVEPTIYGDALLKRSIAAFDELKQSGRDIAFLSDPTKGELRIGSAESVSAAILPQILERFSREYPEVIVNVDAVVTGTPEIPMLRDRKLDLVLVRMRPLTESTLADNLNIEKLFDEKLVIVAGAHSRWARRRAIDLRDLVDAPWILTPADNWTYVMVMEAFRARGLDMPNVKMRTLSVHIRTSLITRAEFITALPLSVVHHYGATLSLKILPVDIPFQQWPIAIVTLEESNVKSGG